MFSAEQMRAYKQGFDKIMSFCSNLSQTKELDLTNHQFAPLDIDPFIRGLSSSSCRLEKLNLSNVTMSPEYIDLFIEALDKAFENPDCKLRKLGISKIKMTDQQVEKFIAVIKKSSTIEKIRCRAPENPNLSKELNKLCSVKEGNAYYIAAKEARIFDKQVKYLKGDPSDDDVAHSDGEVGPLGYYDYDSGPFID